MRFEQYPKRQIAIPDDNPSVEKIIRAAKELFLEKGYRDVTTRAIAARASVNLGLLPYYFGSKENLAKIVYRQIRNDTFREIKKYIDLDGLPPADQLYLYPTIKWDFLSAGPNSILIRDFCVNQIGDISVTDESFELSWQVIRQYGLNITFTENELYLSALVGAEQLLGRRMLRGELNVSYRTITDIVTSNYFFNIGLPDREIKAIISRCHTFMEHLPPMPDDTQK